MSTLLHLITRSLQNTAGRAAVVAATALILVACSPSSDPSGDVGAGAAREVTAEVVIEDASFEPEVLELPAGEEVTVQITNDDAGVHDFAIESLDLNTGTIEAGDGAHATFIVPDEPMVFVCTFHSGMEGRIEPE